MPTTSYNQRKYASIKKHILILLSWRALTAKKLRSTLTIAGIVIGVGSIFFLLSFGLGIQHLVTEQVVGSSSIKSVDITSPNSKFLKLNEDTVQKISQLGHVEKIGKSISTSGSIKHNEGEVDAVVYGINPAYQTISQLPIVSGRLLSDKDDHAVIINKVTAETIGMKDTSKAIDSKLQILLLLNSSDKNGQQNINDEFTIVGVTDSGSGKEVFLPISTFGQQNDLPYTQIKIQTDSTENIDPVRKQIEGMGYQTASPMDTIDQVNQVFKYFNVILAGFGAIGMIVAILGMFNTLTISLLERTKDIGLMFAMGARRKDMRLLFIFEAVLFSVIGAAIGIILATLLGQLLNIAVSAMAKDRGITQGLDLFATPWWLICALAIFTILVGLLVVFLPARRAERINPIDALRRE